MSPMRPLSPCLEPGCHALVRRGRCPAHVRPTRWGQGNRDGQRSTAMRDRVLSEEPLCHVCHVTPSVQADHIVPISRGGSSERSNMAGICASCHRAKSLAESVRARYAVTR